MPRAPHPTVLRTLAAFRRGEPITVRVRLGPLAPLGEPTRSRQEPASPGHEPPSPGPMQMTRDPDDRRLENDRIERQRQSGVDEAARVDRDRLKHVRENKRVEGDRVDGVTEHKRVEDRRVRDTDEVRRLTRGSDTAERELATQLVKWLLGRILR